MSIIPFPDKKYNIIYADPPWQYNESWGNGQVGYDTMTNEDICKLPVRDLLAEQAHLYLWVTNPFIAEGLEICKEWGFDYKTLITWVKTYANGKPEMGMGYYFRGCTEHIIFGDFFGHLQYTFSIEQLNPYIRFMGDLAEQVFQTPTLQFSTTGIP